MTRGYSWKPLQLSHRFQGQEATAHNVTREKVEAAGDVLASTMKVAYQRQPTMAGLAIGLGVGAAAIVVIYLLA